MNQNIPWQKNFNFGRFRVNFFGVDFYKYLQVSKTHFFAEIGSNFPEKWLQKHSTRRNRVVV